MPTPRCLDGSRTDHEDAEARGIGAEPEASAAALGNVGKAAKKRVSEVGPGEGAEAHAGTPAILLSRRHSA